MATPLDAELGTADRTQQFGHISSAPKDNSIHRDDLVSDVHAAMQRRAGGNTMNYDTITFAKASIMAIHQLYTRTLTGILG